MLKLAAAAVSLISALPDARVGEVGGDVRHVAVNDHGHLAQASELAPGHLLVDVLLAGPPPHDLAAAGHHETLFGSLLHTNRVVRNRWWGGQSTSDLCRFFWTPTLTCTFGARLKTTVYSLISGGGRSRS
jgi:hypothetical protein